MEDHEIHIDLDEDRQKMLTSSPDLNIQFPEMVMNKTSSLQDPNLVRNCQLTFSKVQKHVNLHIIFGCLFDVNTITLTLLQQMSQINQCLKITQLLYTAVFSTLKNTMKTTSFPCQISLLILYVSGQPQGAFTRLIICQQLFR